MSVVITDRGQTTSYFPLSWFPSTYNLETSSPSLTIKLLSPLHKHIEASTGCVWYFKQTNMTSNSALNLKSRAFCGTAECKFSNSTTQKNGSKNTTIYHLAYGIWINQENQQDSCVGNQSAVVSVLSFIEHQCPLCLHLCYTLSFTAQNKIKKHIKDDNTTKALSVSDDCVCLCFHYIFTARHMVPQSCWFVQRPLRYLAHHCNLCVRCVLPYAWCFCPADFQEVIFVL